MIHYAWFVENIKLPKNTALAMEKYVDWELSEMITMSDVDIARRFQPGVHLKLFAPRDVMQLVERMDIVYKERTKTGLLDNLFSWLTEYLEVPEDQAYCIASYLNMLPETMEGLHNEEIEFILFPAVLEGFLNCSDITLLLDTLKTSVMRQNMYTFLIDVLGFHMKIASVMSRLLDVSPRELIKLDIHKIRDKLRPAVADKRLSEYFVHRLISELQYKFAKIEMQATSASSSANPYVICWHPIRCLVREDGSMQ